MTEQIIALLRAHADEAQAKKMSAYMQNKFVFAGIPKPILKELILPFLSETAKQPLNWPLVFGLWDAEYREAQYVALEYLKRHHRQLRPSDLEHLCRLILTKPWWETVDTIDALIGEIVLQDASLKDVMLSWANDENIWLRRTAIDFQQAYKEKTDTELLEKIIVANFNSSEYFINKAIGWSLRDYSKTNPEWVRTFTEKHQKQLAPLSLKEAMRLL